MLAVAESEERRGQRDEDVWSTLHQLFLVNFVRQICVGERPESEEEINIG